MDPETVLEMIKKSHSYFLGTIDLVPEVEGFSPGQKLEWKDRRAKELLSRELGQGPFEIILAINTAKWKGQVVILNLSGHPVPVHPSFFALAPAG